MADSSGRVPVRRGLLPQIGNISHREIDPGRGFPPLLAGGKQGAQSFRDHDESPGLTVQGREGGTLRVSVIELLGLIQGVRNDLYRPVEIPAGFCSRP